MTEDLILTSAERELVRREFMSGFGDAVSINDGFHLKRWATGPKKGQPKLSPAVQGLIERGLITVDDVGFWPRARFTARGFQALKRMATDRRALDPERHRQLIDELAQLPEA